MAHKLFHVGVKALITDSSGKILLFKTPPWDDMPAYWDLPGGRIEDNQTAEDALRREILEETGITNVTNIAYYSACISNIEIPVSEAEKVGLVLFAYTVDVPDGVAIQLSDEHTDYEWVERSELPERLKEKYPAEFTSGLLAR
jgi:8-oxo-dGTP diphosphatase